jgi:hypothetical protein
MVVEHQQDNDSQWEAIREREEDESSRLKRAYQRLEPITRSPSTAATGFRQPADHETNHGDLGHPPRLDIQACARRGGRRQP